MDFNTKLKLKTQDITGRVYKFLPEETGDQINLIQAMNYAVKVGGKRLRPLIMFETYNMFNGRNVGIEPFMAAIEFIHTYSLIHDDLPAMDNDMLRRGKPTVHAVYGDAMAILAGDALLNLAFETAMKAFGKDNNNPDAVAALRTLSQKAGIYGMVGGQSVDVESEKKNIPLTKEKLTYIHNNKTGALLEAAFVCGAQLAGASEDKIAIISNIAKKVGLAFQIQDDILDVIGNEAVLGKPVGSDAKNNKETYVSLYGMDVAKSDVSRLTAEALYALNQLDVQNPFLIELIRYMAFRES